MSEGSWLPTSWKELRPQIVWGVLILGFGLEFCAAIVSGSYGHALLALVGLGGMSAMLIHGEQFKQHLLKINSNWIYLSFAIFLVLVALLPFFEEKRWPFSAWFAATIIHDPPTAEDIVKEIAPIRTELENEKQRGATLQSQLTAATASQDSKNSPVLGLNDAKRWKLSKVIHDSSRIRPGSFSCDSYVAVNEENSAKNSWSEFEPILIQAGWAVWGGETKAAYPNGIDISVGGNDQDVVNCANHLSEILRSLRIDNVTLNTNQTTKKLSECHNRCIDITVGNFAVH
jgi:hypothetical protein